MLFKFKDRVIPELFTTPVCFCPFKMANRYTLLLTEIKPW